MEPITSASDDLAELTLRFRGRLVHALDQTGFPWKTPERARALAAQAGICVETAQRLLLAQELPSLEELFAIGRAVGREPGFFLNAHPEDTPPWTRLIRPRLIGPSLALTLPDGLEGAADAATELVYERAGADMGFGVQKGDWIVMGAYGRQHQCMTGDVYLLDTRTRYELRRCAEVRDGRAIFRREGAEPLIWSARSGRQRYRLLLVLRGAPTA